MTILPFQALTQQLEEALYRLHYTEMKRKALEKVYPKMITENLPHWEK